MLRAATCEQSLLSLLVCQEGVPELGQAFEVAEGRTSGLANLVFSRQTGFASASIRFSPEARTLKEGFRTMIGSEKV